ncbi:BID domain-containing T4SS effector, partial [Bartonella bilalgolemii]
MALVKKKQRSESFLIPPRPTSTVLFDKSFNEIEKSMDSFFSQNKRSEIRKLSAIVFRDKTVLDKKIDQIIIENPNSVHEFAALIRENPEFFGKLAGFKKFGLKTLGRIKAEKNILKLSDTIIEYVQIVDEISNNYLKKVKRFAQPIEMLNDNVLNLLNQPSNIRQNILKQQDTSELYTEISYFLDDITYRLSASECEMLKNRNYEMLAESVGISEHKAQEIINIVEQVENMQLEIQMINESKFSKNENIYESYDPYEAQAQNSESFLVPSEKIDPIYE